jgi:hypothetical protein
MTIDRILQILDQLEALGFTNAEFQALHHLGKATSIQAHRKYLTKIKEHVPNGTNIEVGHRLEQRLRELQSK